MKFTTEVTPIVGAMLGFEWMAEQKCFVVDVLVLRLVVFYRKKRKNEK